MLDSDVVYGKIGIIQRCLHRIRTVTGHDPARLDGTDVQDIFVLNVQRAVQATIDLAAHVIASEGFGVPQDLKESFKLLAENKVLTPDLSRRMEKMVGFRDIAVHEYQDLSTDILKSILVNNMKDFEEFYTSIVKHFQLDR